jgi:hypothetical protein
LKTSGIIFTGLLLVLGACETNKGNQPAALPKPQLITQPQVVVARQQARPFDPANVPPEVKEAVQRDIVDYITELNGIIRRRDFREWTKRLSTDYQRYLGSTENLAKASQAERLRKNNITLTSLYDYFIHVVVPSRDHDRVDDIEFVKETVVKAFTVDRNSRKLRLYELERSGDTWIIIN